MSMSISPLNNLSGSGKPEEPKQNAKEILLQLVQDQRNQREEIDKLTQNIHYLAGELTKTNEIVNKQTEMLQQIITSGQIKVKSDNPQMTNILSLKELLDSKLGEKLIDRIFPEQQGSSLIPIDEINAHMKKSMMGNFEVGEALIDTLKSKIVNKAITKTVSEIMLDEHSAA